MPHAISASRWLRALAALALVFTQLLGVAQPAIALSTTVVISQFQVAGATSADEFVELHNVGTTDIDLNGYRLVYRSSAGTTDTAVVNWASSTVIPAGGYYLIAHAAGYDDSVAANITFNAGSTGSFSGTAGGFALRNGAANTGSVIDSVGYGTATNAFVETATTTAPAVNASKARNSNGCTDTDNNSSDFSTLAPSTPHNSSSAVQTCGSSTAPSITTQPASQTINSGGTATLSVTASGTAPLSYQWYEGPSGTTTTPVGTDAASFTTPALGATTSYWVRVSNSAGSADSDTATITVDAAATAPSITTQPASQTINSGGTATLSVTASGTAPLSYQWYEGPSGATTTPVGTDAASFTTPALSATTSYWVRVSNSAGSADSDTATITVVDPCTTAYTHIYSIQGSGTSAAITGSVTTQGVVVGDFEGTASASGFYIQDPAGDGNDATSDGIFVFTGSADTVSAGQLVRVTGYAHERFNQTALNASNSNTDPVLAASIVSCGTGSVGATDVAMPFASATFPERYEGMLVRFPQQLVIAEYFNYDQFGEIVLALPLDGEPRPFSGTVLDAPGAAANARTLANSLRRITLDDAQSASNPVSLRHPNGQPFALNNLFRGGDKVQNAVGVLGYDFNLYRIIPTAPADYTATNPRPSAPEPVGGSLRVAAMNTLNFFLTLDTTASDSGPGPCGASQTLDCRGADANQPDEFPRQRNKLLAALSGLSADVIGLNELENTPNVDPLGDPTNGVVAGLNALLGAGTYSYIHTGVIGTDAIRVGMIYKPGVVTPIGPFKTLTSAVDPRFIDTKSRPSLAQTFEVNATGARFTVVVNHFKSKGSACTDVGDPDLGDGQGNCSQTRRAAAEALVDWIATDPTNSGDPDYIVVGDLNSYTKEDTLTEIQAGADDIAGTSDDFTNLIAHFQGAYAYSYTFDGQAGYLDHALASASLLQQVTGAADWHINSDEPDVVDYDTSFKPPSQEALYEPNANRSSDHDPVVVGLNLINENDAPVAQDQAVTTAEDTAASITLLATDGNNNTLTYSYTQPAHGTVTGTGANVTYTPAANYSGPDSFTFKANDGTVDSNVATVTISITAVNDNPTAVNDAASVKKNGSVVIAVRANDTDADGDALTIASVTQGTKGGKVTINANGTVTFKPKNGYKGTDTFTYTISDGHGGSATATVTITITP